MNALLIRNIRPDPLTGGADTTGKVVIAARIGPDGNVEKATVLTGPPALRPSALFAVRQFLYKPYRIDGHTVEVETTVSVNYMDGKPVSGVTSATAKPVTSAPSAALPAASPSMTSAPGAPGPANWSKSTLPPVIASKPPTAMAGLSRKVAPTVAPPAHVDAQPIAFTKLANGLPAEPLPMASASMAPTEWRLVKRVAPLYPQVAELDGTEGIVQVEAIVRKDGSLRELKAISGPEELRQAALDAASQFEYVPANGKKATAEGTTYVSVEFLLKGPAKVPAEVMAGRIEHNVTPLYPPGAEAAGVTGMVTLHVFIDRQGHVQKAEALDGPVSLRPTALEAVKQWTWQPYLRRGVHVEVDTTVIMAFSLKRSGQQ